MRVRLRLRRGACIIIDNLLRGRVGSFLKVHRGFDIRHIVFEVLGGGLRFVAESLIYGYCLESTFDIKTRDMDVLKDIVLMKHVST